MTLRTADGPAPLTSSSARLTLDLYARSVASLGEWAAEASAATWRMRSVAEGGAIAPHLPRQRSASTTGCVKVQRPDQLQVTVPKESTMTKHSAALAAMVVEADDPIVRYKARRYLNSADPTSATMRRLQDDIADSPIARGLLADLAMSQPNDRQGLSTIYLTFRYLADIDYPPGDDQLVPYREHIYRWLRRLEHEYDGALYIRGTHRVHASFHANAIYASVALGLADDETDDLCSNLLRYQWPGGGWNCNKKPATKGPTIVHTAFGLRGLATYRSRQPSEELNQAIDAAAEMLLDRRVYLRRSDGQPLRPVYTKLSYPYPRLYDFMTGLHILARCWVRHR